MAVKKPKSMRKLERHFKGVANHHRIDVLLLVAREPGITLDDIVTRLHGNIKTFSEHTRKLVVAGLLEKSYAGRSVEHRLTPYGEIFAEFIVKFANVPQNE